MLLFQPGVNFVAIRQVHRIYFPSTKRAELDATEQYMATNVLFFPMLIRHRKEKW